MGNNESEGQTRQGKQLNSLVLATKTWLATTTNQTDDSDISIASILIAIMTMAITITLHLVMQIELM